MEQLKKLLDKVEEEFDDVSFYESDSEGFDEYFVIFSDDIALEVRVKYIDELEKFLVNIYCNFFANALLLTHKENLYDSNIDDMIYKFKNKIVKIKDICEEC